MSESPSSTVRDYGGARPLPGWQKMGWQEGREEWGSVATAPSSNFSNRSASTFIQNDGGVRGGGRVSWQRLGAVVGSLPNNPCLKTHLASFLLNHQWRARVPPTRRRSLIPVPINGIWLSRIWIPVLVSCRLVEGSVVGLSSSIFSVHPSVDLHTLFTTVERDACILTHGLHGTAHE